MDPTPSSSVTTFSSLVPEPETPFVERPWENLDRMVSVEEALERVLASVAPLPPTDVSILDALGMVLAGDVESHVDVPPFRNSAMDGYAARAADTHGASPETPVGLRLVSSIAAGQPATLTIEPGCAARIMTGAPLPPGTDCVVRFEETDETSFGPDRSGRVERDWIGITHPANSLDNVREQGEDLAAGEIVLSAGTTLRPAAIGLLASLNRATISVHRRPRVGILSTGDEVVDLGPDLLPGQIRDSNTYLLASIARSAGAEVVMLGIARDDADELRRCLTAADDLDLLVSSGGVSLGDYDMVKDVMRAEGEIDIWQVRMKPGKPLAFGSIGTTPILGLPGNPVAAAVSFEQFGRPAIGKMLGRRELAPRMVEAMLTERIDNRGRRRHYVRARLERSAEHGWIVRSAGDQGAGVLMSLVRANALLIVSESLEVAEVGMRLPVQILE